MKRGTADGIRTHDKEGDVAMARTGKWVVGIGILAGLGVLGAQPGSADDAIKKCSLATLSGQYLVSASGVLYPPAFGVTQQSTSAAAGYSIYNGDGTGTDYVTFTVDGVNVNVTSPTSTTYTLKRNCTGTRTVLPNGPNFDIYVAYDGSALTEIATDTGVSVTSKDTRVTPSH